MAEQTRSSVCAVSSRVSKNIVDINILVSVSYQHFRYQWNIGNFSIFYHTFSNILALI